MSHISRRALLAGVSACAAMPALAKTWPDRPITLIHGFPAGGPADTVSRIIADGVSRHLGQPVVVQARPGATGTAAGGIVARAQPDGYTLMTLPATYPSTAAMLRSLPYRPVDDFSFISTISEYPLLLATYPDSGMQTVAEVISRARSRSVPLLYGTAGIGSPMHLTMELFALKTGIKLQHVPYQGGMPAATDLLAKRIDLMIDPPTTLMQFVKSQRLRGIAVTGTQRLAPLPEVPTMIESGFVELSVVAYNGLVAPHGLPEDILIKIEDALAASLSEAGIAARLRSTGNEPHLMRPEEFRARVAADIERWKDVVDKAHVARI